VEFLVDVANALELQFLFGKVRIGLVLCVQLPDQFRVL